MDNKPKVYSTCKAGCEWETVHKEDFEKSAAYIPVNWSENEGNYYLSSVKEYKIFAPKNADNNFTCSIVYKYKDNGVLQNHAIAWTNADKYADSFVFRLLEVIYGATEITLVYEIAGKRYAETIMGTALSLLASDYLNINGATKVLIFNAEAEVVCRGEQGIQGEKGEQGVSVTNIDLHQTTSGAMGVDYAMDITLSNGETISHQFTVERSNGVNGTDGRDGTVTHTAIIEYVIADNPQQGVDYYYDNESFVEPMAIHTYDLLVDTNGNVYTVFNNQSYLCRFAGFSMKGQGGGAKEAYINIDDALSWHNSAIPMFCLQTPYYNNTIVGGTLWDTLSGGSHFILDKPVKLEFGKTAVLSFSLGPGSYTYTLNNISVTEANGVYYWHTQDISCQDSAGNTYYPSGSENAMICSLLLKSSEV